MPNLGLDGPSSNQQTNKQTVAAALVETQTIKNSTRTHCYKTESTYMYCCYREPPTGTQRCFPQRSNLVGCENLDLFPIRTVRHFPRIGLTVLPPFHCARVPDDRQTNRHCRSNRALATGAKRVYLLPYNVSLTPKIASRRCVD
jgi:hypothetical protein